jgi:glutaminyl-peptide cyclotransferase
MKYFTTLVIFFLLASFILINCAQTSNRSRRPVTSIKLQPKKNIYTCGEKLTAILETKLKDGYLKNIEVILDGKLLFESKNLENSKEINTAELPVGTHNLKVVVTKSDGRQGENYQNFIVVSDIEPQKFSYKILSTYPHNPQFFTQGLEFHKGFLYEGTGQEGSSAIYKTDYKTGKVIKEHKLDNQYFGEGITILNEKIYQLTYKNQTGFVYDLNTFELVKTWKYRQKEGWGITNDGKFLIMSDGTEYIYFLNPETLEEEKSIQVCNNKELVKNINELEYINGEIWANIWTTEKIVIIDPQSGKIKSEISFKGISNLISQNQQQQKDVFNGIALNAMNNKIYVTGKLWPKLFEIELIK